MFNSNSPTPSQTPENEQVDIDFDDIQDRVDDEQEEEQPAPLHHERLPTTDEEEEEEEEPIQEAATVDCKEQELSEWMRIFCAIPTVSTPPAPAPAEKVEEVFEKEHVEVKDPIIGMWICFQPTATQVTVAVSRKFVVYISFHTCNFHLTLVFICSIPTLQLPHRLPIYHLRMNKLISTLMIFRIE
jgi:hypothetical protein